MIAGHAPADYEYACLSVLTLTNLLSSPRVRWAFRRILSLWPTLKQAQRARKARLSAFFHQHNVRYPHIVEARIKAIKAASALTEDVAVIEAIAYWSRSWSNNCACCCTPSSASSNRSPI